MVRSEKLSITKRQNYTSETHGFFSSHNKQLDMAIDINVAETTSLFFLSILCMVSFGVTGAGSGILFQIGYWTFVSIGFIPSQTSSISNALTYISLSSYLIAFGQAIKLRKYARFQLKFTLLIVLITFISSFIGLEVLVRNDNILLTRLMGLLLLLSFLTNVFKLWLSKRKLKKTQLQQNSNIPSPRPETETEAETDTKTNTRTDTKTQAIEIPIRKRTSSLLGIINIDTYSHNFVRNDKGIPCDIVKYDLDINIPWRYMSLIACTIISGFCRGLFGIGGPPMIIYALFVDIDRRIYRAVMSWSISCGTGIITIINLIFINQTFDINNIHNYIIVFIGAIIGLLIGNTIVKWISQEMFRNALTFILFCGSINLLIIKVEINDINVSLIGSISLFVIFIGLIVLLIFKIIANQKQMKFEFIKQESNTSSMLQMVGIPIDSPGMSDADNDDDDNQEDFHDAE